MYNFFFKIIKLKEEKNKFVNSLLNYPIHIYLYHRPYTRVLFFNNFPDNVFPYKTGCKYPDNSIIVYYDLPPSDIIDLHSNNISIFMISALENLLTYNIPIKKFDPKEIFFLL